MTAVLAAATALVAFVVVWCTIGRTLVGASAVGTASATERVSSLGGHLFHVVAVVAYGEELLLSVAAARSGRRSAETLRVPPEARSQAIVAHWWAESRPLRADVLAGGAIVLVDPVGGSAVPCEVAAER